MNTTLKISIITVSYNSESTIAHTINSVIKQDYSNVEYILIDGGSTDWTLNIINNYMDKIDYFNSEEDNGVYDAMNKGIKVASGDIIGILNSDDFYPNNSILSQIVQEFERTNCDCLYGDLVYVDKANARNIVRYWKSGLFSLSKINNGWMLPHPTLFVKKNIYNKFGLYNTSLSRAADYEMIIRLLKKHKINIKYLPKILVKMREGGLSNSSFLNRIKANQEDSSAWRINNLYPPLLIRFLKHIRKITQFFLRPNR